jgi:hypothetical protein
MALLQSVRRWFTREQPLELNISNLISESVATSTPSPRTESRFRSAKISVATMVDELDRAESARFPDLDPDDTSPDTEVQAPTATPPHPLASMSRIEGAISEGRAAQDRIAESVSSVPRAILAFDQAATRQQHLLEILEGLASQHQEQSGRSTVAMERMTESIERSSEVAGLVQRQLDANHQIALETVARLDQVSHAISESNQTSRAVGEAMAAMIGEIRDRDLAQEERSSVLQGWIVASVVGCIAASAAALALAWAVMGAQG